MPNDSLSTLRMFPALVPTKADWYKNKLSKKDHTPSASIVAKSKDRKPDQVPGPGSYSGDYRKVLKSNSSYKIGMSDRVTDDSRFKKDLPGPGQY